MDPRSVKIDQNRLTAPQNDIVRFHIPVYNSSRMKHPERRAELAADLFCLPRRQHSSLQNFSQGVALHILFQQSRPAVLFSHFHDLRQIPAGKPKKQLIDLTASLKMSENISGAAFPVAYKGNFSPRTFLEHPQRIIFVMNCLKKAVINLHISSSALCGVHIVFQNRF